MEQLQQIQLLSQNNNGMIKAAMLREIGVKPYKIRLLVNDGTLKRIRNGYYRLGNSSTELSEQAQITQLFPDGVLCMYSALYYYGYSKRMPATWDIAIDKNASKSRFKLECLSVQPYYLKPSLLIFGVESAVYPDCKMKIFSRDRLICECLKYENKMDQKIYKIAIQRYVADPQKSFPKLLEYAEKRRVLKKAKDRMGLWL